MTATGAARAKSCLECVAARGLAFEPVLLLFAVVAPRLLANFAKSLKPVGDHPLTFEHFQRVTD